MPRTSRRDQTSAYATDHSPPRTNRLRCTFDLATAARATRRSQVHHVARARLVDLWKRSVAIAYE
jgi:hypothetical protein